MNKRNLYFDYFVLPPSNFVDPVNGNFPSISSLMDSGRCAQYLPPHIFSYFHIFYSYFHIFISCRTPRTNEDTKDIFIRKKEFTIFWKDAAAASQQKSCWNFSCCKVFLQFQHRFYNFSQLWCSDFWSFQLLYFQCLVPATQHLTVRPQPWDAEPRGCLSFSARLFNSKSLFLPHKLYFCRAS